ncbi:MAG: hypothetical protein FWD94_07640 [Treponema sp.]|nr:hypothetical protein [Treponema sp.]
MKFELETCLARTIKKIPQEYLLPCKKCPCKDACRKLLRTAFLPGNSKEKASESRCRE